MTHLLPKCLSSNWDLFFHFQRKEKTKERKNIHKEEKLLRYKQLGLGLVVNGDVSSSNGRGFESRWCILDGHFFTMICCKNCINCLKKTENKRKRGEVGPFKRQLGLGDGGKKVTLKYTSPCADQDQ